MCITLASLKKGKISVLALANVKECEVVWCAGSISFMFAASREISLFSRLPRLGTLLLVSVSMGNVAPRSCGVCCTVKGRLQSATYLL